MSQLLFLAVLALTGCKKDAGDSADPGQKPSPPVVPQGAWQQTSTFGGKSGPDGLLQVEIEVDATHTALMVTGSSADYLGVEQVLDPDGNVVLHWSDWWYSDESLTDALFGYTGTLAFNWPVREADGPLTPGTWTVELFTSNAQGGYKNSRVDGVSWLKADDDLTTGSVPVHIVYAKGQDKPAISGPIEEAVEEWVRIWGQRGLTLEPTYHTSELNKNLGFAYSDFGSEDVKAFVAGLPPGELVLIVGETIDGDDSTFGLAGGIPGPLEATPFTWVLIGWLTNAGIDGAFSAEEIRIMGETMAHEVGHFSGLYHPIDFDNGFYNAIAWDALTDTERCVEWQECEAAMADNLMYPYPVCDYYGDGGCTPANFVTNEQAGVWHRYLGVK